jgi:hypothetical protein
MSEPDLHASETSVLKAHECQKKSNLHKNELNMYKLFLFDEPLKGSKSLKIFKINLTFRFDKLSHLSKSVHIKSVSILNFHQHCILRWQYNRQHCLVKNASDCIC